MKGLQPRFYLNNGRFALTDGVEKAKDSIWFYCVFDKFRVYCSDFGANFLSLSQKPISYLQMNKTIILRRLKSGMKKYVPTVTVNDIDIGYLNKDRKQYSMMIDFSTKKEDGSNIQDVTFV